MLVYFRSYTLPIDFARRPFWHLANDVGALLSEQQSELLFQFFLLGLGFLRELGCVEAINLAVVGRNF